MTEHAAQSLRTRFHLDWLPGILIRPRRTLAEVAAATRSTWITPLFLLSLTALALVVTTAPLRQAAALERASVLPPDFQYYSPEQQAQLQQGLASSASSTFIYIFPSLAALGRVWLGWLIVAGLLHLVLTVLGGRSPVRSLLNLVAWAGLPFAVRDLVRIAAALLGDSVIQAPGISGMVGADGGGGMLFAAQVLAWIDVYWLWHVGLLIVAVRADSDPGPGKAWGSVLITQVVALLLLAIPGYLSQQLANLTVIRPFLF